MQVLCIPYTKLADRAKRKNITLVFSHVNEQPMHVMEKDGFVELIGKENFHENIVDALDYAEQLVEINRSLT